jgi:hypothetical protein
LIGFQSLTPLLQTSSFRLACPVEEAYNRSFASRKEARHTKKELEMGKVVFAFFGFTQAVARDEEFTLFPARL